MTIWKMDLKALILVPFSLVLVLLVAIWNDVLPPKPAKLVIEKKWFGPGKEKPQDPDIISFKILVSNKVSTWFCSFLKFISR